MWGEFEPKTLFSIILALKKLSQEKILSLTRMYKTRPLIDEFLFIPITRPFLDKFSKASPNYRPSNSKLAKVSESAVGFSNWSIG